MASDAITLNSRLSSFKGSFFTSSDYPDSVYGESVSRKKGRFNRYWDPKRSKLSAALKVGLEHFPFREDTSTLYLGASTGTTVSHISDLTPSGCVYAVEASYESFVKLIRLAERRRNIMPVLEDANYPERYRFFVDRANVIYQDISQRNQVQIFNSNAREFPQAKSAFLVIKLRAISSRMPERQILNRSLEGIEGFTIREVLNLKPFHKSHYLVYMDR